MDEEIIEIPFKKPAPEVIDICSDSKNDTSADSIDIPWPLWWTDSELAEQVGSMTNVNLKCNRWIISSVNTLR